MLLTIGILESRVERHRYMTPPSVFTANAVAATFVVLLAASRRRIDVKNGGRDERGHVSQLRQERNLRQTMVRVTFFNVQGRSITIRLRVHSLPQIEVQNNSTSYIIPVF